jgi:WD40 repeat protein
LSATASPSDQPEAAFPSFAALRAAHTDLLRRQRSNGQAPELVPEMRDFLYQGQATGALIDVEAERLAAQSLLDYWSSVLERAGDGPRDATLADFDPLRAPELDDANCPYLGLDAFREKNQAVFFGRERLIDEWLTRLRHHQFLAVVGSSGSGKSSLVLGGLVPKLKAGGVLDSQTWSFCPPFVPGSTPLAPLVRLMFTSEDEFRLDTQHLRKLADAAATPLVLVVDQFEELFTVCASDTDRLAFVNNLLNLVAASEVRHTVIVTMRSDFESHVVRLPELEAIFMPGTVRVTPLNAAELREAIDKPAELAGLKFQEGIVDELVKQILGEPVGLPLLQYTLLKLWENRTRNRVTWDAYRRLGGAREALARSADDLYSGLILEDQVVAKRILLRLVRPGEGLDVTSNRVRRATLYRAGEDPAAIDRVLERLIGARLLRRTEGETSADEQIEVAHEALVRNWPRLVDWLEEERVNLRRRLHLTAAAEQWEASNRDVGALWAGVLLAEAAGYDDLNSLETEFVQASRAAVEEALREEAARHRELEQAQQLAEEQRRRTEAESMRAEIERQRAEERSRDAGRLRRYVQVATAGIVLTLLATGFAVTNLLTAQRALNEAELQGALARRMQSEAEEQKVGALLAGDEAERQKVNAQQARDEAQLQTQNAERMLSTLGQMRAAALAVSTNFSDLGVLVATQVYRTQPSPEARSELLDVVGRMPALVTFLRGHTRPVSSVAYSPDGNTVASASEDLSIILWDMAKLKPRIQPLFGHSDAITSVAFSPPDGKLLASASRDKTVMLWDVAKGQPVGPPLSGHTMVVWSVAFSPDGKLLASSSADQTILMWDVATGLQVGEAITGHDGSIDHVVFSPDGKLLASASRDKTVRLWDVGTHQQVGAPLGHTDEVYALAFSPDGKMLASGSLDGFIRLWNVSTRQQIGDPLPTFSNGAVWSVGFNPDGTWLASSGGDTSVLVWNVAQHQLITTLKGHGAGVPSLAWACSSGGAQAGLPSLAIPCLARNVLVTGSKDGTVGLWEPGIGQRLGTSIAKPPGRVVSIALAPDGRTVATGAYDGSVALWDSTTGTNTGASIAGHRSGVNSVAFSHAGTTLASASDDKSISLWDVATGRRVGSPLQVHTDKVTSVVFNPDGTLLASGSLDHTIILWDTTTWKPAATLGKDTSTGGILSLAFSPDGALLASGNDDKTISLWDVPNRKRIEPLLVGHSDVVTSVAFSPDGKTLASGGADYMVRLWDTEKRQRKVAPIHGHSRTVTSVAFSDDGQTLASAGTDKTIILWDPATGQHIGPPLVGHGSWVNALVFGKNGVLYSGGSDNLLVRWDFSSDSVQNAACKMVNRNLTPTEWTQQFGSQHYARTCTNLTVNQYAIQEVIQDAEARLAEGDRLAAETGYAIAVKWATGTTHWSLNNTLCWFGSLDDLAQTVMPACNRAVEVSPARLKGQYRDSRGVARAMQNDFAGAIEDFQAYLDATQDSQSAGSNTLRNKRKQWLTLLEAGTNPFNDHSVLERLHDE